jgi:selenocysteine lyase/cysteine desulfurase
VKETHGRLPKQPKTLLDLDALRADTPGCANVIHFNNAGCGLLPSAVLRVMLDQLELEARIGGYEAAAAQEAEVRAFYDATAELSNARPANVASAPSATHAHSSALSSIPFESGEVILTTRNDFISNQIAFLSLRKRLGINLPPKLRRSLALASPKLCQRR